MSASLETFLNFGWNPACHTIVQMRRVRTLALMSLILLLVSLVFLVRAIDWQISLRIYTISFALVCSVSTLILLRRYQSEAWLRPLSYGLCLGLLAIIGGAIVTGGGSSSVTQGSLVLLPLLAGVMNDQRSAMLWGVLALLLILGVGLLEYASIPFHNLTPPEHQHSQHLLQAIACMLAVLGVLAGFFTQLKHSETLLAEQNQQLTRQISIAEAAVEDVQRAERAKMRFLANMSHELRTPLNAIVGFSRRLEKNLHDSLDERAADSLSTVIRNGIAMQQLVDDLFDLSALEGQFLDWQPSMVWVQSLLTALENRLEAELQMWQATLVTECAATVQVETDSRRLVQILLSLIRFTLKHAAGAHMHLRAENRDGRFWLMLQDSGPPLTPDIHSRLFDRNNHLHSWQERDTGASGLALALAWAMVDMQGGELLCTVEGGCNCFSLWLPEAAIKKAPESGAARSR